MSLAEYSVRKPVTTWVTFLAVLVVGALCLLRTPIDLLPEMDIPAITVFTSYQGAGPEDVEQKITEPLERALSTVPDLKDIQSVSKEGMSSITLSFEWGADMDTRSNDVRDAVGLAKNMLPDDADEPRVFKFDLSRMPIIVYGVTANESYARLQDILNDDVADPLKRIPGVGSAMGMVPKERQVNVDLDRERLASYGLTPADVSAAIARENKATPTGNIKTGLKDYTVRVPGELESTALLSEIVVSNVGGTVRLADVATVKDDFRETNQYILFNQRPAGILMVMKQSGANTVDVAKAVRARMAEIQKRLPQDVEFLSVMDSSEQITRSIMDLRLTLIGGGLLAMLVVLVFLRRWGPTFIIGTTIPFSLVLGIIIMYFLGYTINMLTLFGMIVVVGMVVDDAIVVLENISRHRDEGELPVEAAIYGTSEVTMAVTASTLTTISIFLPVLFVKGITKILFTDFSVVVCVTLLGSLFSALTLTPMLSTTFIGFGREARREGWLFRATGRAFEAVIEFYGKSLKWALGHRGAVLTVSFLLFAGTLLLMPFIGREFMPEEDSSFIQGTIEMPLGTKADETNRAMKDIDAICRELIPQSEREVVMTLSGEGSGNGGGPPGTAQGRHIGTLYVKLVPKTQRSRSIFEIAAVLRKRLKTEQGVLGVQRFRIMTADPMSSRMMGGERPLTVNIIGKDMDATDKVATQVKGIVESIPGAVDVAITREKGKPELWVTVDRDKASSMGLNVSYVADTLRYYVYGQTASFYRVRGNEYDIFVRLREEDRNDLSQIMEMPIRLPGGQIIRAGNIVTAAVERGPLEIERKDQGRIVNVIGEIQGRSLGDIVKDVQAGLDKLVVPAGVEVRIAGSAEDMRESFFWLSLALIVGSLLVYMIMAAQFESFLHPFVVMFSVPFAFTGAIWAVFLGGYHLNIIVFLALLLLIGVVVKNAIVLVDFINILRARGLPMAEAVQEAGRRRLRPVIMTALTTSIALVPMALGKGEGSESWNPLGATVLGGMIVSTFVTLMLVPTLYSILESRVRLKVK